MAVQRKPKKETELLFREREKNTNKKSCSDTIATIHHLQR